MSDVETRHLLVRNVVRNLGDDDAKTLAAACEVAGISRSAVVSHQTVRRSVDARGRREPRFVLHLELELPADLEVEEKQGGRVQWARSLAADRQRQVKSPEKPPVIIGMGPCGLFAALQLARHGIKPIILDRGKRVEDRAKDVAGLMGRGEINPESNLCFGEGGAGTWSDGKLYTRVGGPWIRPILETLVSHGGPDRILVDSRPHLGTDKLVRVLKSIRAELENLGCDLRFNTKVVDLVTDEDGVIGVTLADGTTIDSDRVIFAPGHSARDLYEVLVNRHVHVEPKPFAVGFRVEHTQEFIDGVQYGPWSNHDELPAAYYELAHTRKNAGKDVGVFSFCMCPGGSIVPTPTNEGEICVNGMSHAARSGKHANSAIVMSIDPSDFGRLAPSVANSGPPVLAGVRAQLAIEQAAWTLGGGKFVAPATTVPDYLGGKASRNVRRTTYKRGVREADITSLYPDFVNRSIQTSIREFDRRMRGFISEDGVLVGVETRTSAPICVVRDDLTLQSSSHRGLYPGGEGCGHGGGIMSAAIDGIRIAERVLDELSTE